MKASGKDTLPSVWNEEACLEVLAAEDKKECPNCPEVWINSEVKDLICCQQLIPNVEKRTDQEKDNGKCQDHGKEIITWCNTCKVSSCLKCLREKHKTCEWVLMEEKYEEMVAKINSRVTENGENVKFLDDFSKKLRICCDKLANWRSEAGNELDNPLPLGNGNVAAASVPVSKIYQTTLALLEMERSEPTNQFTRLLHDLSKQIQEKLNGRRETIINKCETDKDSTTSNNEGVLSSFFSELLNSRVISATNSMSTTVVDDLSASSAAKSSHFCVGLGVGFGGSSPTNAEPRTDLTFANGGKWLIRNDSEVAAACKILTDPLVNPSDVSIVVSDIAIEKQFKELLSLIAKRTCTISFKSLYSHWKSVRESEVTAATRNQSRIRSLFNSTLPIFSQPRCILTEFLGYLDVDCVEILPKSLKSIGLVLAVEKDMDVLNEITRDEDGFWHWDKQWTSLNTLQIAVSKTFQPEWWNVPQATECHLHLIRNVSLHFPKLISEQDLDWMKQILVKIMFAHSQLSYLKDIYLPGLLIDYNKVHDVMKSCGLNTDRSELTVHLPIEANNSVSIQTKENIGKWIFMRDLANL